MPSKDSSKPATQADVQSVRSELKSDIEKLDRKVDALSGRVDDLSGRVDDLSKTTNKTAVELVRTQGEMAKMERRLIARMNAGFHRIEGLLDAFTSKLEVFNRESIVLPHVLDEHGRTLKNHDGRIGALEKARG